MMMTPSKYLFSMCVSRGKCFSQSLYLWHIKVASFKSMQAQPFINRRVTEGHLFCTVQEASWLLCWQTLVQELQRHHCLHSHQIPSLQRWKVQGTGFSLGWCCCQAIKRLPDVGWYLALQREPRSCLHQAENPAGPDQMGRHDRHLQHDHQENKKNPKTKWEKSKVPVLQLK